MVNIFIYRFQTHSVGKTKIFLQSYYVVNYIHMPSIYESGEGTLCRKPPGFPLEAESNAAAVIDGSVTLCGAYANHCFGLDAAFNVWAEFPTMDVERSFGSASVMAPSGWWIAGR